MAQRKISELTAITGANIDVDADYLPIVDASEAAAGNRNKRITVKELIANALAFLQSGIATSANRKSRTVSAKLSEVQVSVLDATGVLGDDSNDDTTGINNVFADATKHIHFPAATYKLTDKLTILSGTHEISGDGIDATIIKQYGDISAGTGTFYANSGSSSSYITGLYIHDLTIDGQVATLSFSQFAHLLALHGVKDVVIERVKFLGFRGDGCLLGSGLNAGDERHNVNVTIRDCVFDGVNSDNRNGTSIIDGDGVYVYRNRYLNCTKSTMPGPIDVEPNANAFHIVRNIHIADNRIESFSGGQGITVATTAEILTAPMFGIKIKRNYIAGATKANAIAIYIVTGETISASTVPMGIEIGENEVVDTESAGLLPFRAISVRDIKITKNTFKNGTSADLGSSTTAAVTVYDAVLRDNTFYQNGNANGALTIGSVDNVTVDGNTIDSPNAGAGTIGIRFVGSGVTTVSSNVRITNNTFIKGASQTTSIGITGHTLDTASNSYYGNKDVGGALATQFTAYGSDVWLAYTPVITGSSGAGAGTYSTQVGRYQVIGKTVRGSLTLIWTAHTGTGNFRISVPLTAKAGTVSGATRFAYVSNVTWTAGSMLMGPIDANTAYIALYEVAPGGAAGAVALDTAGTIYADFEFEIA